MCEEIDIGAVESALGAAGWLTRSQAGRAALTVAVAGVWWLASTTVTVPLLVPVALGAAAAVGIVTTVVLAVRLRELRAQLHHTHTPTRPAPLPWAVPKQPALPANRVAAIEAPADQRYVRTSPAAGRPRRRAC